MAGNLDDIGVLRRREIEARILAPLLEAFGREFGDERVRELAGEVIVRIAREQGRALADGLGDDSLPAFGTALENWRKGDALELDVLAQSEERLEFNVARCRYAELYRELGIADLGALLSCNRDAALIEGFNPAIDLTRTQTIMQGAGCCDFRYAKRGPAAKGAEDETSEPCRTVTSA
ncbi:MAG: L-2-amino-thiazoline-4-carboxylic acid hydrolase [Vulcanimicrobiaceae bacterium]